MIILFKYKCNEGVKSFFFFQKEKSEILNFIIIKIFEKFLHLSKNWFNKMEKFHQNISANINFKYWIFLRFSTKFSQREKKNTDISWDRISLICWRSIAEFFNECIQFSVYSWKFSFDSFKKEKFVIVDCFALTNLSINYRHC